jgi:hypothetical protein
VKETTTSTRRYVLSSDLRDDLDWFWCQLDSELGIRSNMGSQELRLLRLSPSDEDRRQAKREFTERYNPRTFEEILSSLFDRASRRAEKWRRQDEELRREWYTIRVSDDPVSNWGELDSANPSVRARASRIHTTLGRLVKSKMGPWHVTILYAVHGDPNNYQVADEISRLLRSRLAKTDSEARQYLSNASRAYTECHLAHRKDNELTRRARFREILGVAA